MVHFHFSVCVWLPIHEGGHSCFQVCVRVRACTISLRWCLLSQRDSRIVQINHLQPASYTAQKKKGRKKGKKYNEVAMYMGWMKKKKKIQPAQDEMKRNDESRIITKGCKVWSILVLNEVVGATQSQHRLCTTKHSNSDICSRRGAREEGVRNKEIGRQLPAILLGPGWKKAVPGMP